MFKTNRKRSNFYIKNDLCTITEANNLTTMTLKFQPKGIGWSSFPEVKDYFLQRFSNSCVVCGLDDVAKITKHHIFPLCYRKHLNKEYMKVMVPFLMYDFVPLCYECHHKYERNATELKRRLKNCIKASPEYHINDSGVWEKEAHEEYIKAKQINKLAGTLCCHGDAIPFDKKQKMIDELKTLGVEDYTVYSSEDYEYPIQKPLFSIAEYYVNTKLITVEAVDDFIIMWREHFLRFARPKFMPKYYDMDFRMLEYGYENRENLKNLKRMT